MVRTRRASGLLIAVLSLLAARGFAENDGAKLFDGVAGAAVKLPVFKLASSGASAAAAPKESFTQSGADLFYFTPAEAALGAARFGIRELKPGAMGAVFDSNVPANIQAQMKADLAFIGGVAGGTSTPLHAKIFGAVDGPTYTRFFESRVTGIGLHTCGSANAVACVIPFMDPSKMWITKNYIKFSHPQVARLMVVFHESRHTESAQGNWGHARCPEPFKDANGNDMKSIWTGASLAGEPACDETPFGSYGSSTIMLKNIQKFCANCTEKVRMDAGLYADDQMGRIIDDGAIKQMRDDLYK